MFDHRITRALAALVVAGALVSCAADAEPPASGEREGKGKAAQGKRAARHGHQHVAKPAQVKSGKSAGTNGGSASPGPAGGAAGSAAGTTGAAHGDDAAAGQPVSRPSCTDDASGDMDSSGAAPSYADVIRGCVRTDGPQLLLAANSLGPIPPRTPNSNTQLSYGFELTSQSGSNLYVHAQASPDGWTTYLTRGHGQREIGRPTIDGDQVVLTLPLAELRGAQHLEWALESSWLKSSVLGTDYAFDSAPNIGTSRFDR